MSTKPTSVSSTFSSQSCLALTPSDNAYVSGMAEDLGFHGNELVQFQTIFVVGNDVGLLPFIYLFPRVPMHISVPSLDLGMSPIIPCVTPLY
jgi:hypothetical protein